MGNINNMKCFFSGHNFEYIEDRKGCIHSGWTNLHYYGYIEKVFTCSRCDAEKTIRIKKINYCYRDSYL